MFCRAVKRPCPWLSWWEREKRNQRANRAKKTVSLVIQLRACPYLNRRIRTQQWLNSTDFQHPEQPTSTAATLARFVKKTLKVQTHLQGFIRDFIKAVMLSDKRRIPRFFSPPERIVDDIQIGVEPDIHPKRQLVIIPEANVAPTHLIAVLQHPVGDVNALGEA